MGSINKMSAVQINKNVYEKELAALKAEYDSLFHISSEYSKSVKKYTREEYIALYARDIHFWTSRIPDVDLDNMEMNLLAKHAICSNAKIQLWNQVSSAGISKKTMNRAIETVLSQLN